MPLALDDYLAQVKKSDPGYQGLLQESAAAELTSEKGSLLFKPQFFSSVQLVDDTRDTQAPAIYGTTHIQRNFSIGLRGQTPYGVGLQLSYEYNQSNLFNTDPSIVTSPGLTNSYFVPVLNFSLWQNFLGHSDQANRRLMEAQDLANSYGKAYQAKASLVEAEARYWKLAVTREIEKIELESVSRTRGILEYDSKKAKKNLADPSDLLLWQAAVKGKELELKSIQDEEKSAARAFNSARGIDASEVGEELRVPDPSVLVALPPIARSGHTGEVKASEQASIAQAAGSQMAREKLLPDLTLYSSIFAVGVNFSFPLDLSTTSDVRKGYDQQSLAADLDLQKKIMDEDTQWKDLERKFGEAKERYKIALELETIQKSKFENVRKRKARGLTIEDQVFQYELDSLNASLARAQIEGMILGLRAQMKLYANEGENPRNETR
jgi:outer membrane protein TolC